MKILRLQMTPLGLSEVTLRVVASLMIVIQTTLEMSVMLLRNIYRLASLMTIIIYDCHIFIVQATWSFLHPSPKQ